MQIILSQVQRLIGRDFLIAGFIPTLIAVAVGASMVHGFNAFVSLVNSWAQHPGRAVFQIAVALLGIYLLAYVLYGIRIGVSQLYQGSMPRSLKFFDRLLRWNQDRLIKHARNKLKVAEKALDDTSWPTDTNAPFSPTWVENKLTEAEVDKQLVEARSEHSKLLSSLAQGQPIDREKYEELLACARALQSSVHGTTQPSKEQVDNLIQDIRRTYNEHEELQGAARDAENRSLREWIVAQGKFTIEFPDDERWLKPTRFGNILAALDCAILKRYGIALNDLWPRLIHVITDDVKSRVDEANIYLDFTLMMSFLSVFTEVVAVLASFVGPQRPPALQAVLLASPLLAWWIFYLLSMSAAQALAQHIRAAVDLFRLDLLDALSVQRPATPALEQLLWDEIERFIAQGDMPEKYVRFVSKKPIEKNVSKALRAGNSTKRASVFDRRRLGT